MENVNEMETVKTSVSIDTETAAKIKASAAADGRGWTKQLVALAKEALASRERASA